MPDESPEGKPLPPKWVDQPKESFEEFRRRNSGLYPPHVSGDCQDCANRWSASLEQDGPKFTLCPVCERQMLNAVRMLVRVGTDQLADKVIIDAFYKHGRNTAEYLLHALLAEDRP